MLKELGALFGNLDRNECCASVTMESECDYLKKMEVSSCQLLNNRVPDRCLWMTVTICVNNNRSL